MLEKEIILNDLPSEIVFVILSKLPTRSIAICKCVCKSWLSIVGIGEFANLPSEIIIIILSKLPLGSIAICKCVCKRWFNLLGTREFARLHLSRSVSVSGLLRAHTSQKHYSFFEFNDYLDLAHHELRYEPAINFDIPLRSETELQGSTNGLLFLRCENRDGDGLYVCNPVTRDYIKLHCPKEFVSSYSEFAIYGFGVSKSTGQYKVVRIFHRRTRSIEGYKSECHVYTLGTGLWREALHLVEPLDYRNDGRSTAGAFVNGNLHWLACDLNESQRVSCFDLEREVFSTFPCPQLPGSRGYNGHLSVLGDCLCYCEVRTWEGMIIWLLKEQCWTKEFVISMYYTDFYRSFRSVKVFRDGDILMKPLSFVYSTKTKTTRKIRVFAQTTGEIIIYTPSLLSLKSFRIETATSF